MNYRETMSRLNTALNNIDSAYAIIAKKNGLTFNALMTIYLMETEKNITQKQICDALHLPKSTVHSILSDFIKKEYTRLEKGSNKKEKYIVTSAKGKRLFKKIYEETGRIEDEVLRTLGEDKCKLLTEMAETLGKLMNSKISVEYNSKA